MFPKGRGIERAPVAPYPCAAYFASSIQASPGDDKSASAGNWEHAGGKVRMAEGSASKWTRSLGPPVAAPGEAELDSNLGIYNAYNCISERKGGRAVCPAVTARSLCPTQEQGLSDLVFLHGHSSKRTSVQGTLAAS